MRRLSSNFLASLALHALALGAAWALWAFRESPAGAPRPFSVGLEHAQGRGPRARRAETALPAETSEPAADAPAPGTPAGAPSAGEATVSAPSAGFLAEIRERIAGAVHYPVALQRRRVQGTVMLRLILLEDGTLTESAIESSSGNDELDRLAIEAARSASPFPSPELKKKGRLVLSLPVEFRTK